MNTFEPYYVIQRTRAGKFIACMSGMGRNRNTWDSSHSKQTAQRHAKRLQASDPRHTYTVEGMYAD